jgi:hypothetical protein
MTAPDVSPAAAAPEAVDPLPAKTAVPEAPRTVHELITAPITLVPQNIAALAQLEQQVVRNAGVQKTVMRVMGTMMSVSATASVGYLIWAARGGSVLMSMLTSVPMWRFIDPLPVLNGPGAVRQRRKRSWLPWRWKAEDALEDQVEHLVD